ncbi:MAG: SRPBCC domain-containing protein [Cytophagales bacterium]|nr:SRPBCC domain-containing protein [Cytophagales bacterium]
MKSNDYTASFSVKKPASQVFESINNIAAWWTDDLKGNATQVNESFTVQFGDIHLSTQKVIELIPNQKIVWLVTDSQLNFIQDKSEWTNTTIIFEIETQNDETRVHFTHVGLNPSIECFNDCSKGWDYYFKGSLFNYLTEGKGTPGL